MFTGGGTRFAIYGGMLQALEEAGLNIRFIVASCGGAVAASVIRAFDSHPERKAYFQSEEFYCFIRSLGVTRQAGLHRLPAYCLGKLFDQRNAPFVENVLDRYLVDMPGNLSVYLPSLNCQAPTAIPTIVVACRALFEASDVNGLRRERKLYQRVLFTDAETARKIVLPPDYVSYQESAVGSGYDIVTGIHSLVASRISLSDMFYVAPVNCNGVWYMGGAVDLVPTELASSLGYGLIAEYKQRYSRLEESLVRAVMGFSANQRLAESEQVEIACRIDTSDNERQLRKNYIGKRIDWRHGRFTITNDITYPEYCRQIEAQWNFGYERTRQALWK